MKKYIVIILTFIFLGTIIEPSINAYFKDEHLVESILEISGRNSGKQKVELTLKEAEEVEELFSSINLKLNKTESREQAENIINDAVVKLNEYGLLGGLSIKQAQRLITSRLKDSNILNRNHLKEDDDKNFLCLVGGKINFSTFTGLFEFLFAPVYSFFYNHSLFLITNILGILMIIRSRFFIYTPIQFSYTIYLGYFNNIYFHFWVPAIGWVSSYGINGFKNWSGEFYGQYKPRSIFPIPFEFCPGIIGFSGIKLLSKNYDIFFLGSASIVNIGPEHP